MGSTDSLRPQYFLSRPNGSLTALVAVDELPRSFTIHGVPHVLGQGDTAGMTSLGTVASRGQVYSVQAAPEENDKESTKNPTESGISSVNGSQKTISTGPKESVENSKAQEAPKKVYCAYWVRTGQCDFLQQGCKYKHEMNQTILNKFGMREVPKWYREKHGTGTIKTGHHGNQKPEDKKPSSSTTRNNGSADAEKTVGSRRLEQLNKWRDFAEKESGAAPPTTRMNVSNGPGVAAGTNDLLTQDLLPSYTALNATCSSAENLSSPMSVSQQTTHVKSPQAITQGQAKPSAGNTPQKSKERSVTQGTTGTTTSSSNVAITSGAGRAVSPTQRQTRRPRSRRSGQTNLPTESLESSVSAQISGTANNTIDKVNSDGSPNAKTPGGTLPRLGIPASRVLEKVSTPTSNSHKGTQSTLTTAQSTADTDKKEKSEQVKGGASEKDEEAESAKRTTTTPEETKSVVKDLEPGAATDVFGLGIYDN